MDQRDEQEKEFLELAKGLNLTPKQLRLHLTALGWKTLKEAAEVNFGDMTLGGGTPKPAAVLELTAKAMLPQLTDLPTEVTEAVEPGPGYLYVLYDGVTGQSKIGCRRSEEQRQQAVLGAHGNVLANFLNAKVNDMRAAEAQCLQHFDANRKNGGWFSADLEDIIAYIGREIDWESLWTESPARMNQYIAGCGLGDMETARFALAGPNFPVPEV